MHTIEDIMEHRPIYIKEDDFMTRARQLIRDHHHRTLPVVDEKKKVLGVITEQDVLNITSTKSNITVKGYISTTPAVTKDMDVRQVAGLMIQSGITRIPVTNSLTDKTLMGIVSIVDIFKNLDLSGLPDKRVEEYMSRQVKTCSPEDPLAKIWINMIQEGYSGYPVVDKHKNPIGMVTRFDIIKNGTVRIEREDEHGSRMGTSTKVSRVMSTPAFTTTPDALLKDVIRTMMHLDVGRLCVVNQKKLVGIIDRHDMVRAYIDSFP